MQDKNNFTPKYYTDAEPKRTPRLFKGAGIGFAFVVALLINPILMMALKAVGSLAAIILVIYLCIVDTRIHWGWRLAVAIVCIGIISTQYNTLILHK